MSELLALAANLPQDAVAQTQVGRLFLAAGDPRRALDHFVDAVRLSPQDADALAGAGEAAFMLGDYSRALRYLKRISRQDAHSADLRDVAELVLNADPLAPRLGASERRKRLVVAFQQAAQRLETCSSAPSAQATASLEPLRNEAREFQSALELPRRRRTS